nr:MAG TPA: hypothetical protein [Caudoviricetes sp.]
MSTLPRGNRRKWRLEGWLTGEASTILCQCESKVHRLSFTE